MTWRQLRVLIQHLPPESSTMTALRNLLSDEEYEQQARNGRPETGRWSVAEQLLAGIDDSLHRVEHVLRLANYSGKGRKPDPPKPMRRPGVRTSQKQEELTEQGAEFLFTLINGGAA